MKGSLVTAILAVFYTCLTAEANAIYAATSSRTTGAGASTNSYYAAGADLDSCFFNTIASGHSTGTGYIPGSSHGSGTGRGANIPEAAAIRAAIDSIASEYGIPSVAFAVVNRDSIIVADAVGLAAGYEDPERGIAATPGTVYRIGSVTKT
ncbi:MAG: class A beta-lactamase-related serine hydrolase, partial [Marinilabiliales bacterium]